MRVDHPTTRWPLAALAAVVMTALLSAAPPSTKSVLPTTSQPATVNPHHHSDQCASCHPSKENSPGPIKPNDVDGVCLSCHNGKRARRERHPIGRTFARDRVVAPDGWPTPGGKLGCATCHDLRHACGRPGLRPGATPAFVRDYRAGDMLGFCRRCHVDGNMHQRYNPHVMLNVDGKPRQQACQFCHVPTITKHDLVARSGKPLLSTGEPTLCLSCHLNHVDYFSPGHVGAFVSEEMRAGMVSAGVVENLPLAADGTITCSTCHNPHQQGVFETHRDLAKGSTSPGKQSGALRLRGLGKGVCRACHNP